MPLHPSLIAVVTGLDEFEQDVVQRLCEGDWDRVRIEPDDRVAILDIIGTWRRTIFALQPPLLDPDLEQWFEQPAVPRRMTHLRNQHGSCATCGMRMRETDRGRECPQGDIWPTFTPFPDPEPKPPTRADATPLPDPAAPASLPRAEDEAPVSTPDAAPVQEQPVPTVIVDSLTDVQAAMTAETINRFDRTCANPECDKPAERGKKDCSKKCQTRRATLLRKAREDAVGGRAARRVTVEPATPVLEPELIEEPAQLELVQPPAPVAVPMAARPVFCVRCGEQGHFVEDCQQPMVRRKEPVIALVPSPQPVDEPVEKTPAEALREDASQKSVREAKERLAAQRANAKAGGEPKAVLTCARCHERGHSIFTCSKPYTPPSTHVPAPVPAGISDDLLTAHSNALLELCRNGLPDNLGYDLKEDVLALYGLDHDLLDAAVRNPERVEIRPEGRDKDKRYCILGFYRGDLEIIMGMRSPATPRVIAAYAHSRLEHDTHRVGGAGGGSAQKARGLPKSARQVVTRLRAMGGRELEVELDITKDHVPVTYKGQDLGMIACDGDRQTSERDYQRIVRKMEAIDRRTSVG